MIDRDRKWLLGEFVWTGFDYIGEPTPWNQNATAPPKNSYFGIVDTAGFAKDAYYLYESQWTSVEDNPMVHILPHWNWEDAELRSQVTVNGKIPVRIYSNARSVELFKDGNPSENRLLTRLLHTRMKRAKTLFTKSIRMMRTSSIWSGVFRMSPAH